MGQEFVIKSTQLEDKINQLLPSQGGAQAGVDLSASTTIIPIVDLTESAEGSGLRVDLQSAISFKTATAFSVTNAKTTIINTTGYWRILGTSTSVATSVGDAVGQIIINDGTTDKIVYKQEVDASGNRFASGSDIDFIVKLTAGDSLIVESTQNTTTVAGSVRQIADVNGNLTNP